MPRFLLHCLFVVTVLGACNANIPASIMQKSMEHEIVDFALTKLSEASEDKCEMEKVDVANFSKQVLTSSNYLFQ